MLKILGLVIALIGVIFIYDARKIAMSAFGFGDQNEATMGMKITGFAISMIGAFIVYFNM